MTTSNRYPPEVRERAVRPVEEAPKDHPSQWAAIRSVAQKIGCTNQTLRTLVMQSERDQGKRADLTTDERERLKQLERENRELKRANEILKKASAFLSRRNSTANWSDGFLHR